MDKLPYILLIFLVYSCSAGMPDMDPVDYMNWYKQNTGLTREKLYEEVTFAATYKTPELIYLMENPKGNVSQDGFQKRKHTLGELVYFNMKIKGRTGEDLFTAYGLNDVNYPMDLMQNDFFIVQDQDTLPCVLFHFERNYGLSPAVDLSLAFDQVPRSGQDFTLVYNDELFKTGLNKFRFTASAIHSVPKLRLR